MRRLLAILLLAAFGLPVVAPLLALGQDPDANLPICCRRNGEHHCAMGAMQGNGTRISARCPDFPQQTAVIPHLTLTAFTTAQTLTAFPQSTIAAPTRAATQRRISRERSRHKRGPPAAILAA